MIRFRGVQPLTPRPESACMLYHPASRAPHRSRNLEVEKQWLPDFQNHGEAWVLHTGLGPQSQFAGLPGVVPGPRAQSPGPNPSMWGQKRMTLGPWCTVPCGGRVGPVPTPRVLLWLPGLILAHRPAPCLIWPVGPKD